MSHFREPSCSHISGFSDPEVQPLIQNRVSAESQAGLSCPVSHPQLSQLGIDPLPSSGRIEHRKPAAAWLL